MAMDILWMTQLMQRWAHLGQYSCNVSVGYKIWSVPVYQDLSWEWLLEGEDGWMRHSRGDSARMQAADCTIMHLRALCKPGAPAARPEWWDPHWVIALDLEWGESSCNWAIALLPQMKRWHQASWSPDCTWGRWDWWSWLRWWRQADWCGCLSTECQTQQWGAVN